MRRYSFFRETPARRISLPPSEGFRRTKKQKRLAWFSSSRSRAWQTRLTNDSPPSFISFLFLYMCVCSSLSLFTSMHKRKKKRKKPLCFSPFYSLSIWRRKKENLFLILVLLIVWRWCRGIEKKTGEFLFFSSPWICLSICGNLWKCAARSSELNSVFWLRQKKYFLAFFFAFFFQMAPKMKAAHNITLWQLRTP